MMLLACSVLNQMRAVGRAGSHPIGPWRTPVAGARLANVDPCANAVAQDGVRQHREQLAKYGAAHILSASQ